MSDYSCIGAGLTYELALWRKRLSDERQCAQFIDVRDDHIVGSGKVGVWTKADSVTVFNDFKYCFLLNK